MQLFQRRKQNLYSFLFTLPKVARLHSHFLFFGSKRREIDHIVISLEVVCLRPYPPQLLKYGHVPPHPLHTMIPQSKIIILCSICTHTDSVKLCTAKLCLENQNKTYRDQSYPKAFPQIHRRESNFPCSLAQTTPDNKQRFNTHSVSLARA